MVTCAIARDENSLQFILQLTEIGLWKSELLILEQDMKMGKSFTGKDFLKKTRKTFPGKDFLKKTRIFFPGKDFLKKNEIFLTRFFFSKGFS